VLIHLTCYHPKPGTAFRNFSSTFDNVPRLDRILLINAIALAAAMLAAVIGGLAASSWIWAIACAVFVYAGFRVGAMIWMARNVRLAALVREHFRDDRDVDAGYYYDPGGSRPGPDFDFDWARRPGSGPDEPSWTFDRPIDGGRAPRGLAGPSGQD
jgi:hypothetical protein